MNMRLTKLIIASTLACGLFVTPLHADDNNTDENTSITTITYNTDSSENFDLKYLSDTYTVNIRVKGNWELDPDTTTSYKDEGGNVKYLRYDATWDEKDLEFIIDSGETLNVVVDKATISHEETDDYLVAELKLKFQKSEDKNSSKKMWCYKTVTLNISQLETPVIEEVNLSK